jgi:hypothetical protein
MIFLLTALASCRKDPPVPDPPDPPFVWERFIGDYKVYDSTGFYIYDMSILHDTSWRLTPDYQWIDSLKITNFNGRIDVKFRFLQGTDPNYLSLGIHHPIFDYDGYSWHVSGKGDDPNTVIKENTLINDTIILYFQMSNIAFCQAEGVPCYHIIEKQIAVKQK